MQYPEPRATACHVVKVLVYKVQLLYDDRSNVYTYIHIRYEYVRSMLTDNGFPRQVQKWPKAPKTPIKEAHARMRPISGARSSRQATPPHGFRTLIAPPPPSFDPLSSEYDRVAPLGSRCAASAACRESLSMSSASEHILGKRVSISPMRSP